MRKVSILVILTSAFLIQPTFATDDDQYIAPNNKSCAAIAKACSDAGFMQTKRPGKRFWQDCMKPVILGETVEHVTIDASVVKKCRTDKIEKLKKELKDFQKVS